MQLRAYSNICKITVKWIICHDRRQVTRSFDSGMTWEPLQDGVFDACVSIFLSIAISLSAPFNPLCSVSLYISISLYISLYISISLYLSISLYIISLYLYIIIYYIGPYCPRFAYHFIFSARAACFRPSSFLPLAAYALPLALLVPNQISCTFPPTRVAK
eukprot:COSAG05_NODE_519_length_9047_cov_25.276263_11_plen_160_part_00